MTLSTISIPTKIRLYNVYFDTICFHLCVATISLLFKRTRHRNVVVSDARFELL